MVWNRSTEPEPDPAGPPPVSQARDDRFRPFAGNPPPWSTVPRSPAHAPDGPSSQAHDDRFTPFRGNPGVAFCEPSTWTTPRTFTIVAAAALAAVYLTRRTRRKFRRPTGG